MSKGDEAGPVDHLVAVHCDQARFRLTLAEPGFALQPGDRVVWQFFGIPPGWSPLIEFEPLADGGPTFGPFASLSQSAAALWGTCGSDPALVSRTFTYRLAIQKGLGLGWEEGEAAIRSAAGSLSVEPPGRIVKTVDVRLEEGRLGARSASLVVCPLALELRSQEVVDFVFGGIPLDPGTWRPRIDFVRYEGEGSVTNLFLGPFSTLTAGPEGIRGSGNSGVPGLYHFRASVIQVRDGLAAWVNSGDPAIDNRGSAADPTSGGPGGETERATGG